MAQKTSVWKILFRIVILLLAIAVGVGIVANFVSKKQPPQRVENAQIHQPVRVLQTAPMNVTLSASGFGTAAPDKTWSAVSNVKGHVIYRHPDLESGALLGKGTLLLEIDPGFYQLALAEADAEIASVDAEIAQLRQEAINIAALLDLERQRLELAEADLERTRELVASNAVAQTRLDTQLRTTLQQRQAVQSLINQQNITPIQQTRLQAQKERTLSKRAQVQGDLEDTKIYAPFDLRIGDVQVETHQYVNPAQLLFSGDGTRAAEIVLQVPMQSLRRVLAELPTDDTGLNIASLGARVQQVGEDQTWAAQVIRVANGIDPATRTVRVVLGVKQPENTSHFVDNPPLPKGMYVQGTLFVDAGEPRMVIPQKAIHEGWVYLVDGDSRLERRAVDVAFQQGALAVISSGLQPGEMLILDDLVPAISGAPLEAHRDLGAEAALMASAAGEVR